jgi:hypothetical protein
MSKSQIHWMEQHRGAAHDMSIHSDGGWNRVVYALPKLSQRTDVDNSGALFSSGDIRIKDG